MVRAPQPELGYFQGQPSSLDRGFESPYLPLVSPGPAHPPAASFSPFGLFPKQPGVFPQPPAGGEREAGPSLAMPAGTDALNAVCVTV